MTQNTSLRYSQSLKTALQAGFIVGLTVGLFEAGIIGIKVLLSNSLSLSLVAGLVKFLSFNAVLFIGFALLLALAAAQPLFVLFGARGGSQQSTFDGWLLRLVWFAAIFITFGVWLSYQTMRPLLGVTSLVYNGLAFLGAVILAEIGCRFSRDRIGAWPLLKGSRSAKVSLAWLGALILAFVPDLGSDTAAQREKPNVFLLIVDTLRADRLGCYGYDKNATPNIDALARQGVLFEQAYVQWASSLPSHASIMTSLQPHIHGAFPNGKYLNPKLLTLPKILKAHGYTNGAFVTNALVGTQYNFDLGYDTFTDVTQFDYRASNMAMWVHGLNLVRAYDHLFKRDLYTELALEWIERHRDKPFFLWVQWLYPHAPYEPPDEFYEKFGFDYSGIADGSLRQIDLISSDELQLSEADKRHYEALYDGEVAFSDYQIGRVLDKLRATGLLENSLVIITSDHGENLYEHNMEYGHYGVYDSSIRIPLIFAMPDRLPQGARVQEVVQSIDIAPTILDLLGLEIPGQFQGNSLVPLMSGEDTSWKSRAVSMMFRDNRNFLALRDGAWKIILDARTHNMTYELYHIPSDPDERNNLIESEPEVAERLKKELTAWIEGEFEGLDLIYKPGQLLNKEFDKKTIERLRSLGYIK